MSFFENTRKPVGLGGKLMVAMMNLGHTPVATWALNSCIFHRMPKCWTAAAAAGRTSDGC